MHPINAVLGRFGLQIRRLPGGAPPEFLRAYESNLKSLRNNPRGFDVFKEFYYEVGQHPQSYTDFECSFVAKHLARLRPQNVLDIGSYRLFILGMIAGLKVTTVDVRDRQPSTENESVVVSDASRLSLPDGSFDVVTSLCSLEHFGLGRYGDDFDPDGDIKGVREMARVLKPGGRLVLSTTVTRARPSIAYNAHRIYSLDMIKSLCAGLKCEEEQFYSSRLRKTCPLDDITSMPTIWDVYAGCWQKPS